MDPWNVYHFLSPAAGDGVGDDELLGIAGDAANVFLVAEFDLLDGKPRITPTTTIRGNRERSCFKVGKLSNFGFPHQ